LSIEIIEIMRAVRIVKKTADVRRTS